MERREHIFLYFILLGLGCVDNASPSHHSDSSAPPPFSDQTLTQPSLILSKWFPLPSSLTQSISSNRPPSTTTFQTLLPFSHAPQPFPKSSLFCLTSEDGIYLNHQGNISPPLQWPTPLKMGDSIALFLIDIDALSSLPTQEYDQPSHDDLVPLDRIPFLLWAINELGVNQSRILSGLGGSMLHLKGKSKSMTRLGHPWLNDYSSWFTSPLTSGYYFGYDGPCLFPHDSLRQHRIMAIAILLDRPVQIMSQKTEKGWSLFRQALSSGISISVGYWMTALAYESTALHDER